MVCCPCLSPGTLGSCLGIGPFAQTLWLYTPSISGVFGHLLALSAIHQRCVCFAHNLCTSLANKRDFLPQGGLQLQAPPPGQKEAPLARLPGEIRRSRLVKDKLVPSGRERKLGTCETLPSCPACEATQQRSGEIKGGPEGHSARGCLWSETRRLPSLPSPAEGEAGKRGWVARGEKSKSRHCSQ